MEERGKISVIMGIYNCADTLPAAIESVLAQTYTNWVLIMCDDCSTDDTYATATRYQGMYPDRIVVIKNERHTYLAGTLNECLKRASGQFIARMDGDDRSAPERFARQLAFLEANPQIALCGTAMRYVNEHGEHGIIKRCPEQPDRFTSYRELPFCHPTVLARRCVYDTLGGYTSLARTTKCEDRDLWFRFFHAGFTGANLQEPLYYYRLNESASKRCTPGMRWQLYQTELYGYKLLKYPWYWYYKPLLNLAKALVPERFVRYYRKQQTKANRTPPEGTA